jgi:hypothetical protein
MSQQQNRVVPSVRLQSREVFSERHGIVKRGRKRRNIRYGATRSDMSRISVIKGYTEGARTVTQTVLRMSESG